MVFVGSNPAVLWTLISLLQAFFYLIFINVEYPENVQEFFAIFSMSTFNFLPDPFEWIVPNIENMSLPAPTKFIENNVNGLFLGSTGEDLLIWGIVIMLYIFSKLFIRYTRNMPILLTKACYKSVKYLEWSGILRTAIASYTDLTIAALLQLRVLDFTTNVFSASSVCAIICVIFSGACPILAYYLARKYSRQPEILEKKYLTLVEEYRTTDKVPKYFTVLFLLRRLCMVLTLVFLHDDPYVEISLLLMNCIIWVLLLIKYRPSDGKLENWVNTVSEGLFIIIHILIGVLIYKQEDLDDKGRLNIGWGIIASCMIIICGSLLLSVVETYNTVKELIELARKMMKGKPKKEQGQIKKKISLQISPDLPKIHIRENHKKNVTRGDYLGSPRETESNLINNSSFMMSHEASRDQRELLGTEVAVIQRKIKRNLIPKRRQPVGNN